MSPACLRHGKSVHDWMSLTGGESSSVPAVSPPKCPTRHGAGTYCPRVGPGMKFRKSSTLVVQSCLVWDLKNFAIK